MILEAEEKRIITGIKNGIKNGRINVKGPNKYGSYRRRSYVKKQIRRSKRKSNRKSNKKIKKRAVSF